MRDGREKYEEYRREREREERKKETKKDVKENLKSCLGCLGIIVVLYILGVFYYQMLIPELLTRHIVEPGTILAILKWLPITIISIIFIADWKHW